MGVRNSYGKVMRKLDKSTFRAWLCMLSVLFLGTQANAALTVTCPYNVHDLAKLDGALDSTVLGVKVRDWRQKTFDEYIAKAAECIRRNNYISSMKEAEYLNLQDKVTYYARDFSNKLTQRTQSESTDKFLREKIRKSGLQGVRVLGSPNAGSIALSSVVIDLPGRKSGQKVSRDCDRIAKYHHFMGDDALSEDGYQQLAGFVDFCAQLGAMNQTTADALKRNINEELSFYQGVDLFISAVEDASTRPFNAGETKKLSEVLMMIKKAESELRLSSSHVLDAGFGRYFRAVQQINEWQSVGCDQDMIKAKFPAAWKNYHIQDARTPISSVLCLAMNNGAQVRYLSPGIRNKYEGFEVRSPNRTVQVFLTQWQIPGAKPTDPKIMIPFRAQVYGQMHEIDNPAKNMEMWVELGAAVKNQ